MFKRKAALTQVLCEEKAVYEAINKLASACNKASIHRLRWAKVEENSYFFSLFGRLAEVNWIWSEALRQIADKHHTFSKVFKDIYQEEKIVEDARKALQNCVGRVGKLQKQLDAAKKKNDSTKTSALEIELATQTSLQDHLAASVEGQTQKLELYKIDLIKKGLRAQSEGMMVMTSHCHLLLQAQMQLVDLLPDKATDTNREDIEQQMQAVVQNIAESFKIYPPPNGGIDMKKLTPPSPTQSPANFRRSLMEPLLEPLSPDVSALRTRAKPSQDPPTPPESPPTAYGRRPQRQSCPTGRPLPKQPLPLPTPVPQPLPEKDPLDGYAEIDILEDPKDEESLYAEARHDVVLRRTQTGSAGSSPIPRHRMIQQQKHLSTASLDRHYEAKVLDESLAQPNHEEGGPDSTFNSNLNVEDPGYAMVFTHNGSSMSESQESDDGGYVNPIDAIQQYFDSNQQLVEDGDATEAWGTTGEGMDEEVVGSGGEGLISEPSYQSFEDIRKLRELQIQEREEKEMSGVAPDNSGYSRPFDALFGVAEPLKVTPDASRRKLNISPLPWQRTVSPSEVKMPRSPLLDMQMKFTGSKEQLRSEGSSSSLTAGGESSSEATVRTRDYLMHRQPSEPESYLDQPPQGTNLKQPSFNGRPHSAVNFSILRQRSQSDSPTLEDVQPQQRGTSNFDSLVVTDIYNHGNSEAGIKPSDVRAKKVGWLERSVSEASMKAQLKPVSVKKLRSGQARLISPRSLKKKVISDSN